MTAGQFFAEYWSVLLSALLTLASLIWAIIQAKRTGNKKGLLEMTALIPSLVAEAEQMFGGGNGVAKLNYVLTKLRIYALEHNVKANTDDLTAQVESVVATTKTVNVEKTPSVNTTQAVDNDNGAMAENATTNSQVNVNI